jgi:hypothetical protein
MQFMLLYSKVKEISNIYLNLLGDWIKYNF